MFFNVAVVPGQDDFCFGCQRGRCVELAYFLMLRGDASETWLVVGIWHMLAPFCADMTSMTTRHLHSLITCQDGGSDTIPTKRHESEHYGTTASKGDCEAKGDEHG